MTTLIPAQLHDEHRLTTDQISLLTHTSKPTFEGWRCRKNGGPPYEKLGPQTIRYRWGDVKEWLAKRKVTPVSA